MYVLQRNDGKYVMPGGRDASYTSKLQYARIFSTRTAAEENRCVENEHIVEIGELLRRYAV